jgi:hypothetical protein
MSAPMRIQSNGLVGSYVITQGDRLLMTGLTLQGCHDWIAAQGKLPPYPTRAELDEIFGTDILKALLEEEP